MLANEVLAQLSTQSGDHCGVPRASDFLPVSTAYTVYLPKLTIEMLTAHHNHIFNSKTAHYNASFPEVDFFFLCSHSVLGTMTRI